MKYYLGFSGISCVLLMALIFPTSGTTSDSCERFGRLQNVYVNNEKSNLVLAMCLSAYIIVALYSCIFALRRLLRPGVSNEIRKFFLIKHFMYVACFIIIWTTYLASAYHHLFNPGSDPAPNQPNSQSLAYEEFYQSKNGTGVAGVLPKLPNVNSLPIVDMVSTVSTLSTGIILTLIRLAEPYFRFLIRKQWKQYFGIWVKESDVT
jgi:hypothetical protein